MERLGLGVISKHSTQNKSDTKGNHLPLQSKSPALGSYSPLQ